MVRRAAGVLLNVIRIDHDSPRTLRTQVTVAIRDAILDGGLRAGDRLPATRTLARELGIARSTVVEVYERLVAEGLLVAGIGNGTFVSKALDIGSPSGPPGDAIPVGAAVESTAAARQRRRLAARYGVVREPACGAAAFGERLPHEVRPFTTALPALDLFPLPLWAKLNARHWRDSRHAVLGYAEPRGDLSLRRAIAAHLRTGQGIACYEEQIFIVHGAQQAFHLIASVLLQPGDRVWIENPGAIGARNALLAAGATLAPVPVDAEGIEVEVGVARAPDFQLAFATPVHQQPMAVTMSLERRLALLQAADAADAWIIEDDFDGEFCYGSHRLPSLKSIDRAGRVFYVGTFSKTLFPALRLGYFLAPPAMVEIFHAAFAAYLPAVPTHTQAVVADFMEEGHYASHIRRMRRIYRERLDSLRGSVNRHLGGMLNLSATEAGLHTVGLLDPSLDEAEVALRAAEHGIVLAPLRRFCIEPIDANGVLMGFSGFDAAAIDAGARTLARVLEELAGNRRRLTG